jgi:hypothetical protein
VDGDHALRLPFLAWIFGRAVFAVRNSYYAKGHKKIGTLNRTELAYAKVLEGLRIGNKVEWFKYEAIKLRLADNTFYTADFFVMTKEGELQVHEVKGSTARKNNLGERVGTKPFILNESNTKIKVAAELFPFRFFIVWPPDRGMSEWNREEM